jgi:hypothetical protein
VYVCIYTYMHVYDGMWEDDRQHGNGMYVCVCMCASRVRDEGSQVYNVCVLTPDITRTHIYTYIYTYISHQALYRRSKAKHMKCSPDMTNTCTCMCVYIYIYIHTRILRQALYRQSKAKHM